jgi:flagellin
MSGIVLSSSVRQNLLSLQSTADLLSTTQSRLSTGKKVNTALDNPTNFFTAQSLDNRASDISNLLDGVSNGVQVLQAANTGITSLQKLVDSAKSVANQALQAAVGYSTKSSVTTTAISGATANDLRGTGGPTAGTVTAGAFTAVNVSGAGSAATAAAPVNGSGYTAVDTTTGTVAFSLNVDGAAYAINVNAAAVTAFTGAGGTLTGTASALSVTDFAKIVNFQVNGNTTTGAPVTVSGGQLRISSATTGTGSNVTISSYSNTAAGGTSGLSNASTTGTAAGPAASQSFTVTLDGGTASTVTLSAATVASYNTAKSASASSSALTAADVAGIANYQIGSTVASVVAGALTFTSTTTGTASSVATSVVTSAGGASGSTGVASATNTGVASGPTPLNGLTLTIGATGSKGVATNITFGTGAGQVKSLNDLNSQLATNNLQATIDTTGAITITTTNDAASSTIGTVGGTAAGTGKAFNALVAGAPVKDIAAQNVRSNLVTQYNNILDQITSTAQDASYNGVNLLNGDKLNLTFNETGKSTLGIQGVQFNATGLGLSKLTAGTDFADNSSATSAISTLSTASSSLRTQASSLGSNLSIVQIRQDFSKNLINVLQTGSSNLTLADTNEEAANSQALSTRQSIAVSALSLANQSQQSVLQLLR